MTYHVALRLNSTGEIRMCEVSWPWREGDLVWWTDGNFGCDCNRELEWIRAGGREPTDDEWEDSARCGETKYTALYAELPDGTRITLDSE